MRHAGVVSLGAKSAYSLHGLAFDRVSLPAFWASLMPDPNADSAGLALGGAAGACAR